jgi:hypothetical protein
VLFLNQVRNRMEPGAQGETSAGGPPLKLFAGVRIAMLPVSGSRLHLRILKNKVAEGRGTQELEWRRGSGFVESL